MSSLPINPSFLEKARSQSIGYLALAYANKRFPLSVCWSAAGYYIGTSCKRGAFSRESAEYFRTLEAAESALASGQWTQRPEP